jgi:hypothetical protein
MHQKRGQRGLGAAGDDGATEQGLVLAWGEEKREANGRI